VWIKGFPSLLQRLVEVVWRLILNSISIRSHVPDVLGARLLSIAKKRAIYIYTFQPPALSKHMHVDRKFFIQKQKMVIEANIRLHDNAGTNIYPNSSATLLPLWKQCKQSTSSPHQQPHVLFFVSLQPQRNETPEPCLVQVNQMHKIF